MYVRTTKSRGYEYVQLAHNHRDPNTGQTKAKVLHNFGRKDHLDIPALKRLAHSISRFLEPQDAQQLQQDLGLEVPFEFLGAKQLGGTHLLDGVWKRLGLDTAFSRLLQDRKHKLPFERLIFALIAQRALAPGSKLSIESWLADEAFVDGLPSVDVHQLYHAMDFLPVVCCHRE